MHDAVRSRDLNVYGRQVGEGHYELVKVLGGEWLCQRRGEWQFYLQGSGLMHTGGSARVDP